MSRISPILLKIKKCLSVCGVSISDLLNEYNGSSSGVISASQLARILNQCGTNLNTDEIQDLEVEFKYGNGISIPGLIAAVEMSNQVNESNAYNKCFNDLISLTNKLKQRNQTIIDYLNSFERSNKDIISASDFVRCFGNCIESKRIAQSFMNPQTQLINIKDISKALSSAFKNQQNQVKEIPKYVLSLISLMVKKRINLRPIFQSYDKIGCGKIPAETFAMSISSVGGVRLLPQEVQEITSYYFDSNGFVNYIRFINDVDLAYQNSNIQQSNIQAQKNIDVQKVMNNLKKTLIERRINISEIFPQTKTGKLSQYAFSRILSQNNLGLTNQEIESITLLYSTSQQEVDYQKFLSFFIEKKVEKLYDDINKIMRKIAHYSTIKHSNLKGILCRYDRDGSSIMPAFQFLLALQQVGINLSPNEINELCRAFPGNYQNSISLTSFFAALSPLAQNEENILKEHKEKYEIDSIGTIPISAQRENQPSQIILDIINKISYTILRQEIQIVDDFKNLDKGRHNFISKNVYFEYITRLNAGLSVQEIKLLFEYYRINKDNFDYVSFCKDMSLCIRTRVGNSGKSSTNIKVNENISPDFQAVLYRVRAFEIKKMLDLNDLFAPYDHMKNGNVPCKIVISVFTNNGLLLNNNEFSVLTLNFQDSLDKEMFHYRSMVAKLSSIHLSKESVNRILFPEYFKQEMERELFSVRPEIKEKLHVRRKNVFMIYSNAIGPTMSEDDFFNRLSDAGIIIMKSQREALTKYYSNPGSGQIDYRKFCNDVENSSPLSF